MKLSVALGLFIAMAPLSPLFQDSRGNLQGVVRDAITGDPISGFEISADNVLPGVGVGASRVRRVTSDSEGSFKIDDLTYGNYRVTGRGGGYGPQEYGALKSGITFFGTGTTIEIGPNQKSPVIRFLATPAGNLEGRVTANDGAVLPGIEINLLRRTLNEYGETEYRIEAIVVRQMTGDNTESSMWRPAHTMFELVSPPSTLMGYHLPQRASLR